MPTGTPYTNAQGTATARIVKSGYTVFKSGIVNNPNTTQVWLQIFNVSATASVTLGSTSPTQSFLIAAGDGTNDAATSVNLPVDGITLGEGFVWAITTTRSGSSAPSSNCSVNFSYA